MINNYNESYAGHLPVRVLQHNIIHQFENTTTDFPNLSEGIIKRYGLNKEINYLLNSNKTNGNKVRGPYVLNSTKQIHIQETFLAYLWCICYSTYIFTGNLIDKNNIKNTEKATELMQYSLSLLNKYSDWDKTKLINPEIYSEEDAQDIEITNEIFINAFNFILCHEFHHVAQGHIDKYKNNNISNEEKLEFEVEADKKAIEIIKEGATKAKNNASNIGIVTAICSLLFFKEKVSNRIHPDSDVRIISALEIMEVEDNDITWVLACSSLNLWMNLYKIDAHWEEKKTFKSLFKSLSFQLK